MTDQYKPSEHDGLRKDGQPDQRMQQEEALASDQYKPSENDGLRMDGQLDQRMQQDSFAYGKVDPHEAGKQGGHTGGTSGGDSKGDSDLYKPSEHDGLRKDGQLDQRMQQDSFAYGKVDPHEAGKQGGRPSTTNDGGDNSGNNGSSGSNGLFAGGKVDPVEAGRKGGKSS